MSRRTTRFAHTRAASILLLLTAVHLPNVGWGAVAPVCLAIEQAFAANDLAALERIEPTSEQETAHRAFRLASAHLQERRRGAARAAIKVGARSVAGGLRDEPDDVELLLLGAMLDGQQVLANRWSLFSAGGRAQKRLRRALALDPDNPRAALIQGTSKLVLPGIFGGSAREAVGLLEPAVDEEATCAGGSWGQVDILLWLGEAQLRLDRPELAGRYFRAALERSPGNNWVRRAMAGNNYVYEEAAP